MLIYRFRVTLVWWAFCGGRIGLFVEKIWVDIVRKALVITVLDCSEMFSWRVTLR